MESHVRSHDVAALCATLAGLVALTALVAGRPMLAAGCLAVALGAGMAARRSSRRHPGPMPFAMRWVLYLPRWPLTVARLHRILAPKPGERLLEVGPGVGIYSVPIATTLGPMGRLDALDVQRKMLRALELRTRHAGVINVVPAHGDAQRLPYPDGTFDAAFLVAVLGEIPDPLAALREFRRVLKPHGRLVVGEVLVVDPDAIRLPALCEAAIQAGFVFERRLGPRLAYFARFRLPREQA
jgi:SAM-dependent methyltransferase